MTRRWRRFPRTRPQQIGFLVLLALCSAQVAWWMIDQIAYTAEVQTTMRDGYEGDAAAARVLLRSGAPWADVARIYPELALAADSTTVSVAPGVLESLRRQRFHRINRYGWEGGFFLVVLLGAMAAVSHALREEAALRRRQELFLAAVSHELKSPLASVRLSVETLALRDPPPARRGELVQRLLADVARLERMIANTLDTARLTSAKVRSAPERLALADAVAAAVEELREQAAECEIVLATAVPAGLVVDADPEGMRIILRNLLHNAIRAACGGGSVTVRGAAADGRVSLEVRDDGAGFPSHERAHLFDKFYRLDGETRERMAGTGLGLYLVRRCAELDGGAATAESAGPGHGAVFTVSWPAPAGHDA